MEKEKTVSFSNLPQFLSKIQKDKLKAQQGKKNNDQAQAEYERRNILNLNLVVGVDCSGSISSEMFHDFMIQLDRIKGMSQIKVVEVASIIRAIYDFKNRNRPVVRLQGGGGNGEHLFFPLVKKMKPDAIIYMTDGYCTKATNPDIPVAWVLTKNGTKPYPWGNVVGVLPH